jgi:hypothetical protein
VVGGADRVPHASGAAGTVVLIDAGATGLGDGAVVVGAVVLTAAGRPAERVVVLTDVAGGRGEDVVVLTDMGAPGASAVVVEVSGGPPDGVVATVVVVESPDDRSAERDEDWHAAVPVTMYATTNTSADHSGRRNRSPRSSRYSRGMTTAWMLDLLIIEPLRSIIAVFWSLLFLGIALAVIIGLPVAIGVSDQRRQRS